MQIVLLVLGLFLGEIRYRAAPLPEHNRPTRIWPRQTETETQRQPRQDGTTRFDDHTKHPEPTAGPHPDVQHPREWPPQAATDGSGCNWGHVNPGLDWAGPAVCLPTAAAACPDGSGWADALRQQRWEYQRWQHGEHRGAGHLSSAVATGHARDIRARCSGWNRRTDHLQVTTIWFLPLKLCTIHLVRQILLCT